MLPLCSIWKELKISDGFQLMILNTLVGFDVHHGIDEVRMRTLEELC